MILNLDIIVFNVLVFRRTLQEQTGQCKYYSEFLSLVVNDHERDSLIFFETQDNLF